MDDPSDTVRKGYTQGNYAEEFRQRDSLTEFEEMWFERFADQTPEAGLPGRRRTPLVGTGVQGRPLR